MKKHLMIFAFMVFFFTNCSKENSTEFDLPLENSASATVLRSSQQSAYNADIDPFLREVFEKGREYYQADPYLFVPNHLVDQLKLNYIQETNKLQVLGFENYLSTLVTSRAITQELADTYMAVDNVIKSYEESTMDKIPMLQEELSNYKTAINISSTIGEHGRTLTATLDLILLFLETEYGDWLDDESAQQREDCPLGEAIVTALNLGTAGGVLGLGAAITAAAIGLPITAGFAVAIVSYSFIAGFVSGFFSGLFGFPSNNVCDDCVTPDGITLIGAPDCSMSRTLHVFGSGDDANIWEWGISLVSDPNTIATLTTTEPTLPVTQVDPADPLIVRVRPTCINEVDYYTKTIDLSIGNGSLSEAGTLSVEPGEYGQTYDVDDKPEFILYNTNAASGYIEFSVETSSSIVSVEGEGDNHFRLSFSNTGTAFVTFRATNICSGQTTTDSVLLTVTE